MLNTWRSGANMEWGKSRAVDEVSDVFEEEFKIFACPVIRTHKYIVSDGRLKHHRRCDSIRELAETLVYHC